MHLLLFLLIIFLVVPLFFLFALVLRFVARIKGIFSGKDGKAGKGGYGDFGNARGERRGGEPFADVDADSGPRQRHHDSSQKFFSDDEGEYVDYEEVG